MGGLCLPFLYIGRKGDTDMSLSTEQIVIHALEIHTASERILHDFKEFLSQSAEGHRISAALYHISDLAEDVALCNAPIWNNDQKKICPLTKKAN